MARRAAKAKPAKTLEQTLWDAADKLRGNQEPSEYKHVVLGLVFLKYVASIIGQVPTSRIGGLHMHTTEPVGIIASCSRRSRRG